MTSVTAPAVATIRRRNTPAFVRALHFRSAQVGLALTVMVVLVGLIGPWVAPHSPTEFVGVPFAAPGGDAMFGTDKLGRDVLSRVLWGGRDILWMTTASTVLGVGVGVVLGLAAGYVRSLDNAIMRPLEVVQSFPALVLVLLFISLVGPETWLIILLVAVGNLPSMARVTRGMTVDIATRDFVAAAEIRGFPRRDILMREILPNISTPLLVEFGIRLTFGIAIIASLSFIGFGQQPPAVDWGLMVSENREGLTIQPWAIFLPTIAITMFAIGTTLLTEGYARTIARVDRVEAS